MAMVESAANSDRPALVLDMDGVLIAWDSEEQPGAPPGYTSCQDWLRPRAYYNPDHADWLRDIQDTQADIYYISDVRERTHEFVSRNHELPEFDWIDIFPHAAGIKSYHALRAKAITRLFGNRPVAWVDDIITDLEFRWAEIRSAESAPTLVVKTELETGMQPEHMATVESWLGSIAHR